MKNPNVSRLAVLIAALFIATLLPAQILINEYSASNLNTIADNNGKYEDWIELYNPAASAVNLGGYFLSDKLSNPTKWQIPATVSIPAGGRVVFWCSGRDEVIIADYHTNFKLSQTKANPEYVVLADPVGNIIDSQQLQTTQAEHSRGRTTDGAATWSVFPSPTPKNPNGNATAYSGYTARPSMNQTAGFYPAAITVTLTNNEPNSTLRYTLDGREPAPGSPAYTAPLNITATTVVKARAFSNAPAILPGLIEFNTYFIGVTHSLPVWSCAGDAMQPLLNGNQFLYPHGTTEYFDETGTRTSAGRGEFNSHGQDSWVHDQRSFDYIARDEMGYDNAVHHKLYPLSNRDEFQRIILRAEGDDNYPGIDSSAHMRDMYVQTISTLSGLHLDVRKGAKCVVYVDGQYWGVYTAREKVDDHDFTEYYYGQDKYNLQMIMTWGNTWSEYGGQQAQIDWSNLKSQIVFGNMADPQQYQNVIAQYDYRSLVDYVLINSYVVCSDWLNWNTGWWRGLDTTGGHLRWGYILWDEDATFGHYINYTGIPDKSPTADPCDPETLDNSFSDPEDHITILKKLRQNPDFDQYYINRYLDLLNTGFSCDHMLHVLDSIATLVTPEMQAHFNRWGGTATQWQANVQELRDYVQTRCTFLPQGMNGCYQLTGPYHFAVNVQPAGWGHVQVNSLTPNNFPWSGNYHGGVPVKLKALETDPNYVFDHWEVLTHSPSPHDSLIEVTLNLTTADSVVAHFKPAPPIAVAPEVDASVQISVYPNPFDQSTTIEVLGNELADALVVYDLLGNEARRVKGFSNNKIRLDREGLAKGMYFFRVFGIDGEMIGTGMMVAE